PFILSILGYIFDISKKTGILTHVKMPVFRQSEESFILNDSYTFGTIILTVDRPKCLDLDTAAARRGNGAGVYWVTGVSLSVRMTVPSSLTAGMTTLSLFSRVTLNS
ncbi:hypothetical protein SAMN05444373_10718, partial [Thermoclostridium caenicola]